MDKITWLGQAGLLFEHENIKIMVDPYLSDSCGKINPNSRRKVEVDERFLKIKPVVTEQYIEEGLKHSLPERHHKLIPTNLDAVAKGKEMIEAVNTL